ncbi:alkaline phosphatase D family protein [Acinetobacter johnsonii]|uniref:Alkaline phosphatase n=2 Tax=Acinetobacter johnsonii TaxID=40214 RepID=A0A2W5S210_ACIJO|nr:alkaline phosphatase D family protein [Acinetobacter johnsonii]NWK61473.1 alkaline phosphatase D family protein [Acinetobacter sp. SwsAc3]EEY96561.1 Tat pathway signal sequence domain protein [Acinetobacter johnsonii SH046]MDH0655105.1 alkaline phosphatase D family protein [Acinetobacter johnsonii]PZQ93045.1 MAG: alkaline phosphatase [Acinetobacter johnsonii]QQT58247.1 alkaline phosphatase D family protein [Acinetobacter johnsonii]
MTKKMNRRELIQKTLAGFGALSLPISLTACGDDADSNTQPNTQVQFLHGVASGDPLQTQIIIWTRVTPSDSSTRLEVQWDVAKDADFKHITATGKVLTTAAQDFTVKVDVTGLAAGQVYFYRFKSASTYSTTGQTKTLATQVQSVQFAVCSCSNYPAGYFHVYKEIAKQDVDVVIHLGDYIYEYGMGGYATEEAVAMARALADDNNTEIIRLDDYRKRYALYRLDPDLQAAHQRHPFIVIWDDHELANDAWEKGAENHQSDTEGDFLERKLAALAAYFEWMPIRPIDDQHIKIYRQFDFGTLVQLTMLDTRIIARNVQLDYANYMTATGLDIAKFQADLINPARTLMGVEQRNWLLQKLQQSTATWNVLGQQILMSKMFVPAELLMSLAEITAGNPSPETLSKITTQITELLKIKARMDAGDPTVSPEEKARLAVTAPYNLDAWDGYFAEREILYGTLAQLKKKVVVLAGDTHNAWASDLSSKDGVLVGVELATSSVSSPGLEKYLSIPMQQLQAFEFAFTSLIEELNYCNLNQRGYLKVRFTAEQVQADWIFVDSIKHKEYIVDETRSHQVILDPTLLPISALKQTA